MFRKLLQFEIFYQLLQRAFPIFAILFLVFGVFVGSQELAPSGVDFNSVYQIYFFTSIFTLGSVFIVMFFAISAILRDKEYNMENLIYSSSITKSHFFWSRFLGTFIFSVLAFSPFIIGFIFGNHFFNLDPERVSDFRLISYLQPWLYIVIPNIFICATIIFSVSTLTKNSTATYVSAVFIYMLYFVSSIFLNSPIIAQAVPASPESMALAALADPFGIAAFIEQTQYWTPYQKNTQLLSFSGLFMANRIIWMLVSFGFLLVTYRIFSFRKITKKAKKETTIKNIKSKPSTYKPINTVLNFKAQRLAFFSLLKIELHSVFKSLPFVAVLLIWLFIVFSNLYSTLVSGGEYGVSVYPFTNQLIALIKNPLTFFSLILIVFYSSDIVWRERSLNFNIIVDATPVKNWVFFLSKFSALLLLPIILITSAIIICILFQLGLNYTNFEFSLYGSLFYHNGLQLAVYCMIALFVNSLVKTKYMGMGIFGLIVILSLKADMLGFQHPLTSLGFMPGVSYSNMTGFSGASSLFNHLSIYWLALGFLLVLISFKIWNRGVGTNISFQLQQLKHGWTKTQKLALAFFLLTFTGAGSLVFYNVNIVTDYETSEDRLDYRENYERKFKKFENLERPYVTSRKTEVELYPKLRMYTVKGDYILKNKSNQPLSKVFITEGIPLSSIAIENASLIERDSIYGTYLFQFNEALQPNESAAYKFELKKESKGYDDDKTIVNNGTYITHGDFEQVFGYVSRFEIANRGERKKRNLPKKIVEKKPTSHIVLENVKIEKTSFETIVSTDNDQTALSSGNLIREWTDNDRKYYHYKSKDKILPGIGYFSANYKAKKINHKGVSIEQYYDEHHNFNIDEVENSVKQTLDYCQENFGSYTFDHVRIAEVPSHVSTGGFAHPGMISMTEDRLYLSDVRNSNTFNLVSKRTIHEVAHQWWGHTLLAKPVVGGSLFVEGFAKYTEGVIMENMFGKSALFTLSENARSRYFSGRSFARDIEPPVYMALGQGYISYGKAYTVLMALRDLIGEKQVNQVLKTMTERHRYTNKLEANTIELLDEIYKVTPQGQHVLIDDWFKKVITYDLGIDDSSYKVLANGTFEVTVKVKAKRFETLNNGEVEEISIDEPINIGVFAKHPSLILKDDTILNLKPHRINKEFMEFKIIVDELPKYVAIDPYGTRSDENLVDNVVSL